MAWRVMLWGVKIHLVMLVLVLLWFHANNGEIGDHWALVAFTLPLHLMLLSKVLKLWISLLLRNHVRFLSQLSSWQRQNISRIKGLVSDPPDHPKAVTKFTKEQRLESLIDWKVAFLYPGIFHLFFVRQRLCEHQMPITQHQWICKIIGLGKKMKVKHRVQWRLLMVMNCIIFLDSVGLMLILKRDYRRSVSGSKQILSRSYMYNIWIESPEGHMIYHLHGES